MSAVGDARKRLVEQSTPAPTVTLTEAERAALLRVLDRAVESREMTPETGLRVLKIADDAARLAEVTAERDRLRAACPCTVGESVTELLERAQNAEAERDRLAQAMWDARCELGFDPDGDSRFHTDNWELVARNHVREAREVRRDLEQTEAERDRLRDVVARVEALADEWDRYAAMTDESEHAGRSAATIRRTSATVLRAALPDRTDGGASQ